MAAVSTEDIRRLARLARLDVPAQAIGPLRDELSAVLGWMEKLGEVDLDGVVPMTRPGGSAASNRLDADEPGRVLANDDVMGLAPEALPPYFRVPRVLGEGGGA